MWLQPLEKTHFAEFHSPNTLLFLLWQFWAAQAFFWDVVLLQNILQLQSLGFFGSTSRTSLLAKYSCLFPCLGIWNVWIGILCSLHSSRTLFRSVSTVHAQLKWWWVREQLFVSWTAHTDSSAGCVWELRSTTLFQAAGRSVGRRPSVKTKRRLCCCKICLLEELQAFKRDDLAMSH